MTGFWVGGGSLTSTGPSPRALSSARMRASWRSSSARGGMAFDATAIGGLRMESSTLYFRREDSESCGTHGAGDRLLGGGRRLFGEVGHHVLSDGGHRRVGVSEQALDRRRDGLLGADARQGLQSGDT